MIKKLIIFLLAATMVVTIFSGCKGASADTPTPQSPQDELAQQLADQGIGAYENSDGAVALYSMNGAHERLVSKDNQIMYFNDYDGAEVVMTLDENGYPHTISGNFGTIVIGNISDNSYDFAIFDLSGNMELHYNVPIDPDAFAMMQNILSSVASSGAYVRGIFNDANKALTFSSLAFDSFLCGASIAAISVAAPVAGFSAVKYCGGALITLAGLAIHNPYVSDALLAAHTILNPGTSVLSLINMTASNVALVGAVWEDSRESQISLSDGVLMTGGGQGDIKITLSWDTTADIDLWVYTPNSYICYYQKTADNGQLDYDDTNGYGPENVYWQQGTAPAGEYKVVVDHYGGASPTDYQVMIQIGSSVKTYSGTIYTDDNITIDTFTIGSTAASVATPASIIPANRDIDFNNLPAKN